MSDKGDIHIDRSTTFGAVESLLTANKCTIQSSIYLNTHRYMYSIILHLLNASILRLHHYRRVNVPSPSDESRRSGTKDVVDRLVVICVLCIILASRRCRAKASCMRCVVFLRTRNTCFFCAMMSCLTFD